jgi:hypothetical protein
VLAILVLIVAVATLLALLVVALKGLRDGDRPLDVTVRAAPARTGHPEGAPRSVVAWVHNPGSVPVLVGLSVRRSRRPGWLAPGVNARVPLRTSHRRFGPGAQEIVGVVAPGEGEGWPVPAPAGGRRGRLVAVIGQAGGRLRVITLAVPLVPGNPLAEGTGTAASPAPGAPARR